MINLTEYENRVLNIIKTKFGFRNRPEAIELVIHTYAGEFLEPELRPEFIGKMGMREKEPIVQMKDFRKHFGLKEDV